MVSAAFLLLPVGRALAGPTAQASWAPFEAASPKLLVEMQEVLSMEEGLRLCDQMPLLSNLHALDIHDEYSLRAAGALAARLPEEFEERYRGVKPLHWLLKESPRPTSRQLADRRWLVDAIRSAYVEAAPEAARLARARLQELGPGAILEEAAKLKPFVLFDPGLRREIAKIEEAAQARKLAALGLGKTAPPVDADDSAPALPAPARP